MYIALLFLIYMFLVLNKNAERPKVKVSRYFTTHCQNKYDLTWYIAKSLHKGLTL